MGQGEYFGRLGGAVDHPSSHLWPMDLGQGWVFRYQISDSDADVQIQIQIQIRFQTGLGFSVIYAYTTACMVILAIVYQLPSIVDHMAVDHPSSQLWPTDLGSFGQPWCLP